MKFLPALEKTMNKITMLMMNFSPANGWDWNRWRRDIVLKQVLDTGLADESNSICLKTLLDCKFPVEDLKEAMTIKGIGATER